MINQSQIYKFASLRSPKADFPSSETEHVTLETPLTTALAEVVENTVQTQEQTLNQYNSALQDYVTSGSFVKSGKDFAALQGKNASQEKLAQLYDNIVVRTLTKSNTNLLFKQLMDEFRNVYAALKNTQYPVPVEIAIPEAGAPNFIGFKGENEELKEEDLTTKIQLLEQLNSLSKVESLLFEAEKEHVSSFPQKGSVRTKNLPVQGLLISLGKDSISVADAKMAIGVELEKRTVESAETKIVGREVLKSAATAINEEVQQKNTGNTLIEKQFKSYEKLINSLEAQGVTRIESTLEKKTDKYDLIYNILNSKLFTLEEAENSVSEKMKNINNQLRTLVETEKYSLIGSKWVNVSSFEHAYFGIKRPYSIFTHGNECNLKFPYQVADLRVVETETVGYLPGEIAHINNTQAGAKNIRETRRLKRLESFESFITDEETFRETDTQSTEKFSLENVSSDIQSKANEISVYASASGSFGPVSSSIDAGFSNSSSSINSSVVAQKEAKEVFERVVDRVSKRVRGERSTMTIEEFEEKVTLEVDNSTTETKSYVYRWLNKLIRGTLKNYGKRLIFEIDIVHPAHYYLSRSIKEIPGFEIPKDPRKASVDGSPVLTIDNITRDNYHIWAILYKIDIEQPPAAKTIVSETFYGSQTSAASKLVQIPEDYSCYTARASSYYYDYQIPASLVCSVGVFDFASWQDGDAFLWNNVQIWCNGETKQIPITVVSRGAEFYVNIEIECHLSEEAYKAWKIKTYNSIVAAYEELVRQKEEEFASFDPNRPGINPLKKESMVKDEIKRETIRKMFRCNPFWLKDNYVVGKEFQPNCCADTMNAQVVKFIETAFDWENMTYQLHPYFYSDKNNWSELLDLSDDNPHFEAFMQASYATVRVPVHRDELKERAAINFLQFNSIANYEVVPEGFGTLLAELKDNQPTKFEYDINGVELPEPKEIIDLGVFKIPTDLVILECGNRDGVKPRGYPESDDEPTSDVLIPKQYSPAIIAESCDMATDSYSGENPQ
ncbi:MAG: hypothetical protein LBE91_14705 [Tannerella sp.]|nr:hypothetical protein [Tannerella sp.]